ncbi:hypothetical protein DDT52_12515 [Brenneria roseae subsp. roseae]|uniref:hypothetical protein n=1 Tax=Brenneria roseae TaxID=1509241 RepID=UPI000D619995|nr:hypothetical protein [Brenneria roseae]PWC19118.1 hypothetical protein DDT52_12515 [Brenneria roseae subsp. roseae]
MKINKPWFLFFSIKVLYSLISLFILSSITKIGDSERYINADLNISLRTFYDSTAFMDFIGGILGLGGSAFAFLGFAIINLCLTFYALRDFTFTRLQLYTLLAFLSFPSYLIWTSVPSKEAIVSGFMIILASDIVRLYFKFNRLNSFVVLLALYIIVIFKPQYMPSIIVCYLTGYLFGKKNSNASIFLMVSIIGITAIAITLYSFNDVISDTVFRVIRGFDLEAGASREEFWVRPSDWYTKAFEGMLLSFWGPTFSEAGRSMIVLFVFIESLIITIILITLFFILISNRFRLSFISMLVFSTLLLLFATYPFGVMNYGSAIRYKQGYYPFLLILFYCIPIFSRMEKRYLGNTGVL